MCSHMLQACWAGSLRALGWLGTHGGVTMPTASRVRAALLPPWQLWPGAAPSHHRSGREGEVQPPHGQKGATFLQGCGAKWDEPEHIVRAVSYH